MLGHKPGRTRNAGRVSYASAREPREQARVMRRDVGGGSNFCTTTTTRGTNSQGNHATTATGNNTRDREGERQQQRGNNSFLQAQPSSCTAAQPRPQQHSIGYASPATVPAAALATAQRGVLPAKVPRVWQRCFRTSTPALTGPSHSRHGGYSRSQHPRPWSLRAPPGPFTKAKPPIRT